MEPLTLVIIEDEEAHFSLMKRAIAKEFPHASVYHFKEANLCLEQLDSIIPTIIITDYLLPGMNGIEFLEALSQKTKDIPVIMITGQGDENVAVRAMKLGTIDYLVKSGDFFTLLPTVIEKVVRKNRLEQSLLKSEKRFQDMAENTSDWIWEMNAQGKYIYSNPVVKDIIGYSYDEVIGRYFYDFFSSENKELLKVRIFELMAKLKPIESFDNIVLRKDEVEVIMETSGVPCLDKRGNIFCYRGISRDISERKHNESRIQQLSQQLLKAQETERQMISCELHDRVAQDLSASKIECDMLFKNEPALDAPVKAKLLEISKRLQGSINAIRDLSYDLQPPTLAEMGLLKALEIYCEEFSNQFGRKVDFQSAGLNLFKLDADTEIHLYRLVQEGLNNIRKHADSEKAVVRLLGVFPNIILRIEDTGKGFDVKARELALGDEKRMGLRSMKERVNMLGGQMTIQSNPMQGTKIYIKIPFQEQNCEAKEAYINH
ncbi:MAG: response regulator [Desulfobacterales bacterium]